jgi:phytoene dehydrogenase-like protein
MHGHWLTMTTDTVDAVVIGSGPNGLVAAIALADAGWQVLVVEAQERVGGAVASDEITAPGFTTDLFSAFYPLAAASPVIRDLGLSAHGLRWVGAPDVLAHPLPDGSCAVLSTDLDRTAANLDGFAAGDGDAWIRMVAHWNRVRDRLLDALFTPFPPVRSVAGLLRQVGPAGVLELARLAVLPVRRLCAESFAGAGGALLLSRNALHSDIPTIAAGSGLFGWLMSMLGQDVGFPVPEGGAGRLADALAARLVAAGGAVRVGTPVHSIRITHGRATGVECADGTAITARRAVLADVSAPALYTELVDARHLPDGLLRAIGRFQWDHATLKVNWALRTPIPWQADGARGAGTLHLGADADGMVDFAGDLAVGRMPERPFLLFGQMTTADPTRSPAGTESAWAYTHVPRTATPDDLDRHVERVTDTVERLAPGFRDRVLARAVQSPADLQEANANLHGGATNGGTAAIHQQLFYRPVPGPGRPETPVPGLYLASAATHPGGGVHGACGWNAARAALATDGRLGGLRRRLNRTAWARLLPAD